MHGYLMVSCLSVRPSDVSVPVLYPDHIRWNFYFIFGRIIEFGESYQQNTKVGHSGSLPWQQGGIKERDPHGTASCDSMAFLFTLYLYGKSFCDLCCITILALLLLLLVGDNKCTELVSQADDNSTSIQCSVVVPKVLNAEANNSDYSHQTMTSKQDFSVYITATKLSDQEKLDASEKR